MSTITPVPVPSSAKESINFDSLTLVEKPNSQLRLPSSLEGCVGYLTSLPLQVPNSDYKVPSTIACMVNILSDSEADARFEKAILSIPIGDDDERKEGEPHAVYKLGSDIMKKEMKKADKSHTKAPGILGFVTKPGCLSFYIKNGKIYAVSEGRWWLLTSLKAQWCKDNLMNVSLNSDTIVAGDARIIRVDQGELGMITKHGEEILLDVGTHVFNSGAVSSMQKVSYHERDYIQYGSYNYLRVKRGYFAKVWVVVVDEKGRDKLVPRLLGEGTHICDNYLFKYDGMVKVSEKVIEHGSIHRITVLKGMLAKCVQESKSRILGEGTHIIDSTDFVFSGFEDATKSHYIIFGTITILRVVRGKIALAWKDNEPLFISEPGLYEFDSPDFSFDSFRDAEERLIQLGAKKVVHVQTGQVGVTYDDGVLKILNNGTHEINSSTHIVHRFLSTQEKSIRLATLSAKERAARKFMLGSSAQRSTKGTDSTAAERLRSQAAKMGVDQSLDIVLADPDSDLTICETKDLVKVGIRADVFYSISDPKKCIMKIDTDELEDLVRETAVATLTNIIRSTALNQIAQSQNVSAASPIEDIKKEGGVSTVASMVNKYDPPPPATAPMAEFFEKTHDEFMAKLHDDFLLRYGVTISNIRIEAFKIMDDDLAEQISKHALTTAQIENEMANLEGMSLISTQKEKTAAEVKMIATQSEATALKTAADNENQRKIDASKAIAEALRIDTHAKAEAEAEAILLKSRAEAESIKLKAAAEAERAKLIAATDLGKQEALLSIYSDMVIKSNSGVEKVVYLDPSVNKDSPFALSSMQNLNNDLHSLSRLGLAANGTNGTSHRK